MSKPFPHKNLNKHNGKVSFLGLLSMPDKPTTYFINFGLQLWKRSFPIHKQGQKKEVVDKASGCSSGEEIGQRTGKGGGGVLPILFKENVYTPCI